MNKPYADMAPDQRLQAVKEMAEFCGKHWYVHTLPLTGREEPQVRRGDGVFVKWSPFTDANARDEVEGVIRAEATWFHMKWFKGFTFPFTAMYRKDDEHITKGGDTKADAIYQVVLALGERKP